MKTLTEFNGFQLSQAIKTLSEHTASGKTPEEAQQLLLESLKLEGDRAKWFGHALELQKKKTNPLKRVVVMSLGEGEKLPENLQKFEEHYFMVETFPEPPKPQNEKRPFDGKFKGKKKGKRGGRGGPKREFKPRDGQQKPGHQGKPKPEKAAGTSSQEPSQS